MLSPEDFLSLLNLCLHIVYSLVSTADALKQVFVFCLFLIFLGNFGGGWCSSSSVLVLRESV